jgi:hypothetical protein
VSGLLIVNADDWGGSEATTDAILGTFRAGRVTSASGMVYMGDSERAAMLAKHERLPVGLHLNLTEPFVDPATPTRIRDRQSRLAERFTTEGRDRPSVAARLRQWVYDPTIASDVDRAIADQVEEFQVLYGTMPTHFDGHNYVDLCPNLFLSRSIPKGSKVRNSLNRFPLERSPKAVLRSIRQALRSRRFVSTQYVLHIAELRIRAGEPPDPRLHLANNSPIEVMGHPDHEPERKIFMSAPWERVLADYRLGSFADLSATRSADV